MLMRAASTVRSCVLPVDFVAGGLPGGAGTRPSRASRASDPTLRRRRLLAILLLSGVAIFSTSRIVFLSLAPSSATGLDHEPD
jgi:hypothetical protein